MRSIGTVLIFLVVTWIGLGYLLSDNVNTHQALAQVQQQADQAVNDKKATQDQLDQTNTKLNTLQQQNDQLTLQSKVLQEQVKIFQGENQSLKNKNADLRSQLDGMKKINAMVSNLMEISPQSLILAIFVPILPISLITSYVVYRSSRGRADRKHGQDNKPKRTMSINVTEEEMQQIVKMRRGR